MNLRSNELRDLERVARRGPIVCRQQLDAEVKDLAPFAKTVLRLKTRGVPNRKIADFFVCSTEAIESLWK